MTPELWSRVEEVLARVQDLPADDRPSALDDSCGGDPELRREVEAMLEADERDPGFLRVPLWSPREGLHPKAPAGPRDTTLFQPASQAGTPLGWRPMRPDLPPPETFGPYRVERRIGQGGMGEVYLAHRDDGEFDQTVAIKLLHPELASSDLVRRFRRERQILARLEHPNIARFIGGGTTDDGRPYLVMQHVDGVPVDQWCAENAPGVDARLRLFCRVCAAVQAAHQNLVVHRDLKPSNILVDANGEPKLLDFGIAKALTPEHEDRFRDIPTAGPLLMTPRYASPEQVRGHTVTTATDVHALGLLLYELLTGSHPFGSGRSSEILNRIESSQPEPPSRRVQRDLPRGEDRSPEDSGGGMKRPSPRRLAGDLDAIVLRALAKDPEARYASAAELEQDVRRHLEHWPVQARRPTPSYLASRFIRRHRLATGAAALVLVLILGFSITALKLWKQAVYEKHRAQEVATFLEDIYPMPDPRRDDGSTVTALELLERSASSLDESLEDQPADRSVLLLAVGSAYHGLAHNEQAERFLIRGVELHRATVPGPSHRLVQGLFDLASVSRALGRPEAPTRLERALDELRAGGVDHPRLATLLNNHATLLRYGGDFATAEALQRDVLAMRIRLYGTGHENVATAWNNLGNTLRQRGRLDEAEAYLRRALAARIELLGKDSPRTLNTDNSLALVLRDRGELAAAESRLRANLASRRRLLGPDHPALGNVLSNLAGTRLMSGDPDEAEVLLEEAYRLFSAAYGAGHVNTGVVLRNQAAVRLAREEPTPESVAEATDLAGAAKDIFAGQFGDDHWRVADAESVLGAARVLAGDREDGSRLLRRGLDRLMSSKGAEARETREARTRLDRFAEIAAKTASDGS